MSNLPKVTQPGNQTAEPESLTIILKYFLFIRVDSQLLLHIFFHLIPSSSLTLFTIRSYFHNLSACLTPAL